MKNWLINKKYSFVATYLIFSFFLLFSCSTNSTIEDGVPRELADYRSFNISNVGYDLDLKIPKNQEEPVSGSVVLCFDWSGDSDLYIDFAGTLNPNSKSIVNDIEVLLAIENEHIKIPNDLLRENDNKVYLEFSSSDKPLNRNEDYLYTLFVPANARYAFPCFDQPDIKALFTLSLTLPQNWDAITNSSLMSEERISSDTKKLLFNQSDLIPTYLFSFTCGIFSRKEIERDGKTIEILYRNPSEDRVSQLDKIFDEMFYSLKWLEDYTTISQPFQKIGFVVLPGYQFGGMEHPGAIQLNDNTIFLSANPSQEEYLKRFKLIAHEISHLWFGDLVTMQWFDDVWTKEVFANLFAAKICEGFFDQINHQVNFVNTYMIPALSTDRTAGTHPIAQNLSNLKDAGLLYGNIIYNKAPIVMRMLENKVGETNFQKGIQQYLRQYAFSNATWDDLIVCLKSASNQDDLEEFNKIWIKEKGAPIISISENPNTVSSPPILQVLVSQKDQFNREIIWPQNFKINSTKIELDGNNIECAVGYDINYPPYLYMNSDGSGYGRFVLNSLPTVESFRAQNELTRYTTIVNAYESFLLRAISFNDIRSFYIQALKNENSEQISQSIVNYLISLLYFVEDSERSNFEKSLWSLTNTLELRSIKKSLLGSLSTRIKDPDLINELYKIWSDNDLSLLSIRAQTNLSYHLAIMLEDKSSEILNTQRLRIDNADHLREFDFVRRACVSDTAALRALFNSLLHKENRTVEPWAEKTLALLNHPSREPWSNWMIFPALEKLLEVQQTGDIFFPSKWIGALLGGHTSKEAYELVKKFDSNIASKNNYPIPLRNKLLQEGGKLYTIWED